MKSTNRDAHGPSVDVATRQDRAVAARAARVGRNRTLKEIRELLRLAGPVILSRAGLLVMAFVDTAFVARYGADDLGALSLGLVPVGTLIVAMVGLQLGTLVMAAEAVGADRPQQCGAIWRRALPYGLAIGIIACLACLLTEPFLLAIGEPAHLAAGGGRVALIAGLSLPAVGLSLATTFLLEGIGRPLPGMLVTLVANVVNVILNAWLVFGGLGVPPLGAEGSATATTLVRWFMTVALLVYLFRMRDRARFGIAWRGPDSRWRDGGPQRRLGYAAGASLAMEASAFSAMSLMAGLVGVVALGAFTLVFNIMSLIFMVALGIATATAVRVGVAHGQGDRRSVARAGWTGLALNTVFMLLVGTALTVWPGAVPSAYGAEAALFTAALPLVAYLLFILPVDGGQVIMSHALRGCQDIVWPTAIHAVSYVVVMLPLAWYLALPAGRGTHGLMQSILIASIVSVGLLALRFALLTRDGRRTPR